MRKIRAGLILGSVFVLSACSKAAQDETLRIGFPEPSTTEGILILNLWQGTWIVALGVAALVLGLLFAALILYRRRSEADVPKQTRYNIPLEILYTIVPLVIVLGVRTNFTRCNPFILGSSILNEDGRSSRKT